MKYHEQTIEQIQKSIDDKHPNLSTMTIGEMEQTMSKELGSIGIDDPPTLEFIICFGKKTKRVCWEIRIKRVPDSK